MNAGTSGRETFICTITRLSISRNTSQISRAVAFFLQRWLPINVFSRKLTCWKYLIRQIESLAQNYPEPDRVLTEELINAYLSVFYSNKIHSTSKP